MPRPTSISPYARSTIADNELSVWVNRLRSGATGFASAHVTTLENQALAKPVAPSHNPALADFYAFKKSTGSYFLPRIDALSLVRSHFSRTVAYT